MATAAQPARDVVATTPANGASQDARKAAIRELIRQTGLIGTRRTPPETGTHDKTAAAVKWQQ